MRRRPVIEVEHVFEPASLDEDDLDAIRGLLLRGIDRAKARAAKAAPVASSRAPGPVAASVNDSKRRAS